MPHNTFQLTSVGLGALDSRGGGSPLPRSHTRNGNTNTNNVSNSSSSNMTSEMGILLQRRRETELKMVQLRQAILALEEDAYVVGVVAPEREVSKESLDMMETIKDLLTAMEIKRDEITHEISCQRMKKHDDAELKQIALEDRLRVEQDLSMKKAIQHAEEERKVFVMDRAAKNQKHQETVEKIREKLQDNAAMQFSQLQKTIMEVDARTNEKQREREVAKSKRLERYWQKDQERTARRVALEEKKDADFERLLSGATRGTNNTTLVVPPRPTTANNASGSKRPASTTPLQHSRQGIRKRGDLDNNTSKEGGLPPRAGTSLERIHPTRKVAQMMQQQHAAHATSAAGTTTSPPPTTQKTTRRKGGAGGDVGVADHKKHRRGHDLEADLDREDDRHLLNAKEECERVRTKFVDKNAQRENDAAENLDRIHQRKLSNIEAMYARRHDADERIEALRRIQQSQLDRSAQERSERAAEAKLRSSQRKVDNRWIKRAQALVSAATADEKTL